MGYRKAVGSKMSRVKRVVVALMVSAALLSVAPAATAAEAEAEAHCFPFVDHPVICLVVCTAQNQSLKVCDVMITCNYDLVPTVCYALGEVWDIVP